MNYKKNRPKIIIMMGFPGSGKSTYIKNNYKDIEVINQDELGSKQKCIERAYKLLRKDKSIIIDRTNITRNQRKIWIDLAKEFKLEAPTLIFMDLDPKICYYRICSRLDHPIITKFMSLERKQIIIDKFIKYLELPELNEGFKSVSIIDVINSINIHTNSSPSSLEDGKDSSN
jgi:bifunctional polynucleotide phosphatase/kinase